VTKNLDLRDIQGNVVRAYGRFGFPVARYLFLNVRDDVQGREFIAEATRRVTSSVDWGEGEGQVPRPHWTLNLAFTYQGLKALGLPTASLMTFSPEFVAGMKDRKDILGDDGASAPKHWDPIWRGNRVEREQDVHVFVALNARGPAQLEEGHAWLRSLLARRPGAVVLLGGHRADDGTLKDWQDVHALLGADGKPCPKEHFGYTDGIGDPVFEGMPDSAQSPVGRGKPLADGSWVPLATGEFLLGHPDEAHEYPSAPGPGLLGRNGSYMVYRKLHQNVATFESYLDAHGRTYPGGRELLKAKFVGRWAEDGIPLALAPDQDARAAFKERMKNATPAEADRMMCDFTYEDDMSGSRCPFAAHARRVNPRSSLQMMREPGDPPGSLKKSAGAFDTPAALANRRRLLRRGLPYGQRGEPARDDGEHGIVIMMVNADINRQFEFVQQQWVNYGNDFRAANDKDIVLGNHSADDRRPSKAVLQTDPEGDGAPYFLTKIPRFVETRGGDYFFVPSLTALRMIAAGIVDPT
jgi:Dyp-type peroxidase family